jgi:hypothetical protein
MLTNTTNYLHILFIFTLPQGAMCYICYYFPNYVFYYFPNYPNITGKPTLANHDHFQQSVDGRCFLYESTVVKIGPTISEVKGDCSDDRAIE